MKFDKKSVAPKGVLWITFLLLCLFGIGVIVSAVISLLGLPTDLYYILGEVIVSVIFFYLIIYIPARIIFEDYLKKEVTHIKSKPEKIKDNRKEKVSVVLKEDKPVEGVEPPTY